MSEEDEGKQGPSMMTLVSELHEAQKTLQQATDDYLKAEAIWAKVTEDKQRIAKELGEAESQRDRIILRISGAAGLMSPKGPGHE